ncbi:hypothetical protein ACWEPB_37505 [Kitasatospora cineracea]
MTTDRVSTITGEGPTGFANSVNPCVSPGKPTERLPGPMAALSGMPKKPKPPRVEELAAEAVGSGAM